MSQSYAYNHRARRMGSAMARTMLRLGAVGTGAVAGPSIASSANAALAEAQRAGLIRSDDAARAFADAATVALLRGTGQGVRARRLRAIKAARRPVPPVGPGWIAVRANDPNAGARLGEALGHGNGRGI